MTELLSRIFDITKLPSKFFAWVAVLSGMYIFLPKIALEQLGFSSFPEEYKAYAGIAFIGSSSFLFINILIWIWSSIASIWHRRNNKKNVAHAIEDLDRDEVSVLREFFIQGRHVIELPVDHPTVAGLMNKHIVLLASRTGYRDLAGNVFPVQLSKTAKSLISAQRLSIPQNPSALEIEQIRGERPNYIRQIKKADDMRGGMFW